MQCWGWPGHWPVTMSHGSLVWVCASVSCDLGPGLWTSYYQRLHYQATFWSPHLNCEVTLVFLKLLSGSKSTQLILNLSSNSHGLQHLILKISVFVGVVVKALVCGLVDCGVSQSMCYPRATESPSINQMDQHHPTHNQNFTFHKPPISSILKKIRPPLIKISWITKNLVNSAFRVKPK